MQVLDTSIANVALRQIAGSLGAGADESTWIVTTYLVASAIIIPISGWLSAVVGRKRYYLICVALFTVASRACHKPAYADRFSRASRARRRHGAERTSDHRRYFFACEALRCLRALWCAVIVAPTVGPTLGGWITDNFSWHRIFFINVPIGVISVLLVHWLVAEPAVLEKERKERLSGGLKVDWVGFVLVALFLGCLDIVLDKG
jgi:DHA2 family multidrug resistance protein